MGIESAMVSPHESDRAAIGRHGRPPTAHDVMFSIGETVDRQ
jgi:hypothetical protein